ncbi:MAG: glycosyltransferase family 2 protein [Candidatus Spechtbacteria bacterium]|nr:glycosyltransferase family 2 protein [Candidatus Spechtbacteria bacterium]
MSLVSITIAAKNEEKNIEKSLSSALRQSHNPIEIFLIDDTSTDKTVEVAELCYKNYLESNTEVVKKFTIIKNAVNLGFGGSHNVGIRRATGDFVLCLNADCELDKDYVQYALEAFGRDSKIAALQGKLINRRTGNIDTTGLLIFKNRRVVNRGQGEKDRGQFEKQVEVWGADGASPMYRREALDDGKIGDEYFDEDFFAYKEDIDLAWRMRLAGWHAFYQPKAIGYHDRSAGEGTTTNLFEIVRARRNISEFAKFHSFANQRLMQIKNEIPSSFFKNFPCIFLKEAMSWPYVLIFERYGWKSAFLFFRLAPKMLQKRFVIMGKKRVSDSEIETWFLQ